MKRALMTGLIAAVSMAIGIGTAGAASAPLATVYDATTPTSGNIPSLGYEATSTSEFGDAISFAGSARALNTVSVEMSSWACQRGQYQQNNCSSDAKSTFDVPITLNIYGAPVTNDDGTVTPGPLLTRATKTFAIPYRPSANLQHCYGDNVGKWWDKKTATCYNGKATTIAFPFKSLRLRLPDTVVIGVSYNTSDYGPSPLGHQDCSDSSSGCPYDSLNVGLSEATSTGSKPYPDTVFWNTSYSAFYCDSTPVAGEFNLDSPTSACWGGSVPAIKVTAN